MSVGFCGSNALAPSRTVKSPSLSRNILSILFKKNSWSVDTSELNLTTSTVEAPVPSNDLLVPPESIVEASSTLGLKSKQSLSSKV